MYDYEEVCPVSKAVGLLCERWTLIIIREMFLGTTRFSMFRDYLPKISPSLLKSRLRFLEEQEIIIRKKIPEKKNYEYQLTPTGMALKPIVMELGKWGIQYAFRMMDPEQLNISSIIRDYANSIQLDELPGGEYTLQFNVEHNGEQLKKFILIRQGSAQVCDDNIGLEVDLYLTASLTTFAQIYFGEIKLQYALRKDLLKVVGMSYLKNNLNKWLGTSSFSCLNPAAGC